MYIPTEEERAKVYAKINAQVQAKEKTSMESIETDQ